jgi:molybdopterin adenylyltransferase
MTSSQKGRIVAVSISHSTGTRKTNVPMARVISGHGIEHDAHAGNSHRQVSLLAIESIRRMREQGADVGPGDFAENITTEAIDLFLLLLGDTLKIGEAVVEVTQIGKECLSPCEIQRITGNCIMPLEGVFARVLKGGIIRPGDSISVVNVQDSDTAENTVEQNHGSRT